jgi:hypothetical protein
MSRFPNRNYNSVSEVNIILIIRKKVENKLKIQEEYIDRIFRITTYCPATSLPDCSDLCIYCKWVWF